MRRFPVFILLFLGVFVACNDEKLTPEETLQQTEQEPLSKKEINAIINASLEKNNEFKWSMVEPFVLWSALMHSDQVLSVGYQPEGAKADINSRIHQVNVRSDAWVKSKNNIIESVVSELKNNVDPETTVDQILISEDEVLPTFEMKIADLQTLEMLRSMQNVRYAEPLGYSMEEGAVNGRAENNIFGCSNAPDNNIPISGFQTVAPGAKVSWNYNLMRIPEAWQHSTGDNITVAVIDTGLSPDQAGLNGAFNNGFSQGRRVEKFGTYRSSIWWWASPDGPNDRCGHGTAMSGTVAAPRGDRGASVGVAYNANLISIRGTSDVFLTTSRKKNGVADAVKLAANRSDVKILSMSVGDIFYNSKIADAIRYAKGKGKLIFCAAGTSTSVTNWAGVIFPANMNETVAVTGIKTGSGYKRCSNCHSGSKVDFSLVMEQNDNGLKPLTLAQSGNVPATSGGSSVATATAAGIAALVWARNPSMSANQVLQKMKEASDLYPSRNGSYGWGRIDALQAVTN